MALLEQEDNNLCSQRKGGVSCEEYKKHILFLPYLLLFYATIEEINGRNFRVQGSDVNDINHRGVFDFSLDENATIMEGSLEISFEELRVGDTIVVTYYGEIWLTDPPSIIGEVKKIKLLKY